MKQTTSGDHRLQHDIVPSMIQPIDSRRQSNAMGPAGVLPSAIMPNPMLPHAGNQQDLNYVMNLLNQLSDQVRQNKEQTEHIMDGVRQINAKKAASTSQSSSPASSFPQVADGNEPEPNDGDPPVEDNSAPQESQSTLCQTFIIVSTDILRRNARTYCYPRTTTFQNNTRTRRRPFISCLLGSRE